MEKGRSPEVGERPWTLIWWAQREDIRTEAPSANAVQLLETLAEWSVIIASEVPDLRPSDREARPDRGPAP